MLTAIALAALLSACDGHAPANASPAFKLGKQESNAARRADTTAQPDQQDALPAAMPGAFNEGADGSRAARANAQTGALRVQPPVGRGIGVDIGGFVATYAMVLVEKRGDVDGDGEQDVLLILQKKAHAASAPRALMILRGAADGFFQKVVENPDAILCPSCGGIMGDPLSDVRIRPGGFVLMFEGGSRETWSRTYSFAYSKTSGDWTLGRIDTKVLDRIDGRSEENHTTCEQTGAVSIKDFDAASMGMEPGCAVRHSRSVRQP